MITVGLTHASLIRRTAGPGISDWSKRPLVPSQALPKRSVLHSGQSGLKRGIAELLVRRNRVAFRFQALPKGLLESFHWMALLRLRRRLLILRLGLTQKSG